MKQRILYIPGLGDGYDSIRRLGLLTWRRRNVNVELIPMRWRDTTETFDQKLARIKQVIDKDSEPVVLIGESAGGAMAIVATHQFAERVTKTVTLCGINQGPDNVNPNLYRRNPAFREALEQSDVIVNEMSYTAKEKMLILYSSKDFTVRPKDTLLRDVRSINLKTPGHLTSILLTLFFRGQLVHDFIATQKPALRD